MIWGNHRSDRRRDRAAKANAWATSVVWGAAKTLGFDGDNIIWGTWLTATTSSGAPPLATTSSGARRRRQHHLGHGG